MIGVSLALPYGLYLAVQSMSQLSERLGGTFNVSVFLHPELDDGAGAELARALETRDDVAGVNMIGKAAGLEEFRVAAGLSSGLDVFRERNPLPVVLVVSPRARDRHELDAVTRRLEGLPQVEFVRAERELLARLEAMLALARRALWLFGALLAAGVMLVVGNTLRLTIEARRAEVEIAKLFGASDAFVRRPFLYQGLVYGGCGALVACGLVVACVVLLEEPLARLAALYATPLKLAGPQPMDFIGLLLCGAGLGLLGAWLWVGRHLRAVQPR